MAKGKKGIVEIKFKEQIFTKEEFQEFVNDYENEIPDSLIASEAEWRELTDHCPECDECDECEDAEEMIDNNMNKQRAYDYFVENMEYFTLERLEGLKAIVR